MTPGRISGIQTRARFLMDEAREQVGEAAEFIKAPPQFDRFTDGVTRVSQIVALLFLGPVIVVSLRLIVVLNQLMTDIFGIAPLAGGQGDIFAWLITALTGGAFLLAAWAWFQFVRTAGFGFFRW